MEYKIGEVSQLLHISKEMIRYYEKKGILTPERKNHNNYRTYSTMDIFMLMEVIQYQSLDFTLREINELIQNNYYEKLNEHLKAYETKINQEIELKQLLKYRLNEIKDKAEACQLNVGHYWVKKIPQRDAFYMCSSHNDDYDRFEMDDKSSEFVFSNEHMCFCEALIRFEEDKETWWYAMSDEYARHFVIPRSKCREVIPSHLYLCTIIDMGEIGRFNRSCIDPLVDYAQQKYQIDGYPIGALIGRGFENHQFKRMMEIQLPIKTLK
ncbi:MAG: MerR family transcriptional regulator [Erysipelotrichaceae bacterium]|nr:MerR family transcriptional regulator [Erysipelotrichaceae bacterium]